MSLTVMGTRHVISAGHYLAAHAGFEILEAGGNAVDAGVAAGIMAEFADLLKREHAKWAKVVKDSGARVD